MAAALVICVLLCQVCAGSVAGLQPHPSLFSDTQRRHAGWPVKGGMAFQALHLNFGTLSLGSREASGISNSGGCKVGAERLVSSRSLLTETKAAAGGGAKGKKKGGVSKAKKAGGFGSPSGGFGGSSSSKAAAGVYDICELYKQVLANNEAKLSEKEYRNKGVSLSLGEGTNVGLVANQDIKAGELIMASKAFEIAFEGECGGSIEKVNGEVVAPDEIKLALVQPHPSRKNVAHMCQQGYTVLQTRSSAREISISLVLSSRPPPPARPPMWKKAAYFGRVPDRRRFRNRRGVRERGRSRLEAFTLRHHFPDLVSASP